MSVRLWPSHAHQEQEVVVPGHHVLGAEPDEREDLGPDALLEEGAVLIVDAVREGHRGEE